MNKEIGRKLTSLTLLSILLASGVTFAIPGTMPVAEASHNANLFVSAENSLFANTFGGPMVVEIVVNDPSISDTDEGKGEPDVTVNGNDVRMIQATDGLWYGYIADLTQARLADSLGPAAGAISLNFGEFCAPTAGTGMLDGDGPLITFTETVGFAVPITGVPGAVDGNVLPLAACGTGAGPSIVAADIGGAREINVVREQKTPSSILIPGDASPEIGQLGLPGLAVWPFIQLYNFNPTGNVEIKYNKGGGTQTTVLTFDTLDSFSKLTLDRTKYPPGASVHAQITDGQLNIDPTDEDSWTFATNANNLQTMYQVFNENGAVVGDAGGNVDLSPNLGNLMFEDNGVVTLNGNVQGGASVVDLDPTADQTVGVPGFVDPVAVGTLTETTALLVPVGGFAPQPMTFLETGSNTGVFVNYDENDDSNLDIIPAAARGVAASITYNKVGTSILVGLGFATIDITAGDKEWNSGEEIPVTLADSDQNRNSRADEDLDVFNPAITIIPSMRIGNPVTLNNNPIALAPPPLAFALVDAVTVPAVAAGTAVSGLGAGPIGVLDAAGLAPVDLFSDIARITWPVVAANTIVGGAGNFPLLGAGDTGTALVVDLGITLDQLQARLIDDNTLGSTGSGWNFLNYDIRSVINSLTPPGGLATGTITEVDIFLLVDTATLPATVVGAFDETLATGTDNAIFLGTRTGAGLAQGIVQISQLDTQPVFSPVLGVGDLSDAAIFTEGAAFGANPPHAGTDRIGLMFLFDATPVGAPTLTAGSISPIVADFMSFGITGDGLTTAQRVNNAIYRFELEETGDNTGTFVGSAEYTMLSQNNILNRFTYTGLRTIDDEVTFIVHEDLTDEDSPRITYLDVGADGVATQISDQEEAPTHSAIVSLDKDNYKVADTVTVTLEDQDLNIDSDLIDIYTINAVPGDPGFDAVGPLIVDPGSAVLPAGAASQVNRGPIAASPALLTDGTVFGRVLDITFDDLPWVSGVVTGICPAAVLPATFAGANGLGASGFTLVETGAATGVFQGDFQIPTNYCVTAAGTAVAPVGTYGSTTGTDIEVNYVDFRDASGETIEVGDGAGVRANTGTVSLDKTVYPVPFGAHNDYCPAVGVCPAATLGQAPTTQSIFPIHNTAIIADAPLLNIDDPTETLPEGDVIIHVRINDPDFDVSATGEDFISLPDPLFGPDGLVGTADDLGPDGIALTPDDATNLGPVLVSITRGSGRVDLATAGEALAVPGGITSVGPTAANGLIPYLTELGPIKEIAPNAGIFEFDMNIKHTDGPLDATGQCPTTTFYDVSAENIAATAAAALGIAPGTAGVASVPAALAAVVGDRSIADRFLQSIVPAGGNYCILQGDIITVQYTDPTDASGDVNTVTDSATFDLRNGVLQSDKSVYIIGSDMILTLIEPDFDLDSDSAESYTLDLIEWDSDAATLTMGLLGGSAASFDPEPNQFRETGDSTGIFQLIVEIPNVLPAGGTRLDRGEEIDLEYTDWGPSGADYVGDEDDDIKLTIYTSNFGATVELDQKVYTWTDKVFITIVAPDHNFDSNLIDEIGDTTLDRIKVATRGNNLNTYKLVETGTDTGIFTGEVILIGFCHDADGDPTSGAGAGAACAVGSDVGLQVTGPANGGGPTNGFLRSSDDDGLTVSFEFTEDETVVGSALIRWNIGEAQFLEASYPATGQAIVRIVDPDMNLNPEAVDNFDVDVWSDSDSGGIDLTVTETNEATGIFEGTMFLTVTQESAGHRLRVAEGDTITAEYEDNTLPSPYTTADELEIAATAFIGTIVPPLERAPASNPRVVDSFGNELDEVSVDQQVQIAADLVNGQDRDQPFAYLVQISKGGVTYSLSWITGSLAPGQSLNPAQSWTPTESGTYDVQIFVWESVDNPDALSPPVETTITVV